MKIAIIGAGNMGGAVARGLAKGGLVQTSDVYISHPSTPKLEAIKVKFPDINITTDNSVAAKAADIVIFAVKPWIVESVVSELKQCWTTRVRL